MALQRNIAVLGAGAWGTALAMLLAHNGHTVQLWDHNSLLMEEVQKTGRNQRYLPDIDFPKSIKVCLYLADALNKTEESLIVVPSHGFKPLLIAMKPFIAEIPQYGIVWATKGLEPETGAFLHTVVAEVLGSERAMAVLSGPSFAREVALNLPAAVMLASNDAEFLKALSGYFVNDVFSIDTTDDVVGVQLAAVVKNILAVAAGLSEGLGFGTNAAAALITWGIAEMMTLGDALHAKRETFIGLSGCGDTVLTCMDNQSRNRRLGLALAKGLTIEEAAKQIGQSVESIYNVVQIVQLARKNHVFMPISEQIYRIMKEGVAPRAALLSLFNRSSKGE